jgi:transcriptional regulator with XRE-family HTH domain
MNLDILGRRIREEREKLNLTQEKLAEDIKISDSYLGQIERGQRSITLRNLVNLVNRLGVTIDYLLSDSVKASDDALLNEWLQLMDGRSACEKSMALGVMKVMFGHMDNFK